jgi:urease accessory protein
MLLSERPCIGSPAREKMPLMAEIRSLAAETPPTSPLPRLERARGFAQMGVRRDDGGRSRLERLYQSGSAKVRLPRVAPDAPLQAILINTAGGLTGGDELACDVAVGDGASAIVATQAAERIYRRVAGTAEVDTTLSVGAGGRLDWLPQETILFDRSSLRRRLTGDVHQTGTLLAVEAVVLGRAAMGEAVRETSLNDVWRIRRGGQLVFADGIRLDGDATAIMAGRATGNGATAFATVVLTAPDAPARLDAARAALANGAGEAGASAWNGMLVARLLAATGQSLRTDLIRLIETLRGQAMPRVWHC